MTGYNKASDFSEVYLFFDYDLHDDATHMTIDEKNSVLRDMLAFFDDETGNGKLYVNYPMVESIRYTKEIPDPDYWRYVVRVSDCSQFKKTARDFSFYGNLDFISYKRNTKEDFQKARQNWEILKNRILQRQIIFATVSWSSLYRNLMFLKIKSSSLKSQSMYWRKDEISILNSFPLFLYEYFK